MLNKTETLIVDTVEHEFLSIGNDPLMSVANLVTCGLIVGTNVPLIIFILNQGSKTFLDWLIVFDCFLCMSNSLLLLIRLFNFWGSICGFHVFFSFFTNLCNRLLTLGVAFYRFTLVLGSIVWTSYQKKILEKSILLAIFLISFHLTGLAVYYREDYRHFLGKVVNFFDEGFHMINSIINSLFWKRSRVFLQFLSLLRNKNDWKQGLVSRWNQSLPYRSIYQLLQQHSGHPSLLCSDL